MVQEWTTEHEKGLMSISEQAHQLRVQDMKASKLRVYEPQPEMDRPKPLVEAAQTVSTVVRILAPPAAAVVGIVAGAKYLIGLATIAPAAAATGIQAWSLANGGKLAMAGLLAGAAAIMWLVSKLGGSRSSGSSGGENHYHYHQYNQQGPNGSQSHQK